MISCDKNCAPVGKRMEIFSTLLNEKICEEGCAFDGVGRMRNRRIFEGPFKGVLLGMELSDPEI